MAPQGTYQEVAPLIQQQEADDCPYDLLIEAITFVESSHGVNVYNASEQAVGWFQIRQIRVDDYNRRTGSSYKLNDFYDYELSREMFIYYAKMYNSWEEIARRWNGSGAMTTIYWNKVNNYLYTTTP